MLSRMIPGSGIERNLFSQSRSTRELAAVKPYRGSSSRFAAESGNRTVTHSRQERKMRFIKWLLKVQHEIVIEEPGTSVAGGIRGSVLLWLSAGAIARSWQLSLSSSTP